MRKDVRNCKDLLCAFLTDNKLVEVSRELQSRSQFRIGSGSG